MARNRISRERRQSCAPEVRSTLRAKSAPRQASSRPGLRSVRSLRDRSAYVNTHNADQFRALAARSTRRRERRHREHLEQEQSQRQVRLRSLVGFVVAILVVFAGLLPLLTTFRQYVASQSNISDLQSQEESLKRQKANLDEQIARWNDNAYVIAQARTRLGFVYPGETSVRVLGADRYADDQPQQSESRSSAAEVAQSNLPWNQALRRSILMSDSQASTKTPSASSSTGGHKKTSGRHDPAQKYTPYNKAEQNPYVLTQKQRDQALKEQAEEKNEAGEGPNAADGTGQRSTQGGATGFDMTGQNVG